MYQTSVTHNKARIVCIIYEWTLQTLQFHMTQFLRMLGDRITNDYDITIQTYRESHTKIEVSKMYILQCVSLKFCITFQRCHLKFHNKFWNYTLQNMHLRGVKRLMNYDILELWHLKSETGPGCFHDRHLVILRWRHMVVMACQITGHSTVRAIACSGQQQQQKKTPNLRITGL